MISSKDYWALHWAIEQAKTFHEYPPGLDEESAENIQRAEEALERHRPPQAKVKRHAPQP